MSQLRSQNSFGLFSSHHATLTGTLIKSSFTLNIHDPVSFEYHTEAIEKRNGKAKSGRGGRGGKSWLNRIHSTLRNIVLYEKRRCDLTLGYDFVVAE